MSFSNESIAEMNRQMRESDRRARQEMLDGIKEEIVYGPMRKAKQRVGLLASNTANALGLRKERPPAVTSSTRNQKSTEQLAAERAAAEREAAERAAAEREAARQREYDLMGGSRRRRRKHKKSHKKSYKKKKSLKKRRRSRRHRSRRR